VFDKVPARVWLLLAIAAVAYTPTIYIYRYVRHDPSRRDVSAAPEDMSWRTPAQLARSLTVLFACIGVAIFIFTPAAAQFAKSPSFLPIVIALLGGWVFWTVPRGVAKGKIQPIVRGIHSTYERTAQPKRFWASVIWNAAFGGLCMWFAFMMMNQGPKDRCHNSQGDLAPQDVLAACNKLIGESGKSTKDLADLLRARAYAYHQMNNLNEALKDYSKAISLDPEDSYSLYNRAIILDRIDYRKDALVDYSMSLKLRPDNFNGLVNRGILFAKMGRLTEAQRDLTKAHELRPKDVSALVVRGFVYVELKDRTRAKEDFTAVLASDPENKSAKDGLAALNRRGDVEQSDTPK